MIEDADRSNVGLHGFVSSQRKHMAMLRSQIRGRLRCDHGDGSVPPTPQAVRYFTCASAWSYCELQVSIGSANYHPPPSAALMRSISASAGPSRSLNAVVHGRLVTMSWATLHFLHDITTAVWYSNHVDQGPCIYLQRKVHAFRLHNPSPRRHVAHCGYHVLSTTTIDGSKSCHSKVRR
jgi:hypothetical protein